MPYFSLLAKRIDKGKSRNAGEPHPLSHHQWFLIFSSSFLKLNNCQPHSPNLWIEISKNFPIFPLVSSYVNIQTEANFSWLVLDDIYLVARRGSEWVSSCFMQCSKMRRVSLSRRQQVNKKAAGVELHTPKKQQTNSIHPALHFYPKSQEKAEHHMYGRKKNFTKILSAQIISVLDYAKDTATNWRPK